MDKKNKTLLFSVIAVLAIILFPLNVYCSLDIESAVKSACSLRNLKDTNLTITDIRNNGSSAFNELSIGQIDDILLIVNDKWNNSLATLSYYEEVCINLSKEDIEIIYTTVTEENFSNNKIGMKITALVGVAIIFIIIVIGFVILKSKNNNKNQSSSVNQTHDDIEFESDEDF